MEYNDEINNDMGITPRAIKEIFSIIKEVKFLNKKKYNLIRKIFKK